MDWIAEFQNWNDYRPSRSQQAYEMREQGLTFREIGRRLGVTASRARQLFRSSPQMKELIHAELAEKKARLLQFQEEQYAKEIAHNARIAEFERSQLEKFLADHPVARVFPSGMPWYEDEMERDPYGYNKV